jgi:hypothetical protein
MSAVSGGDRRHPRQDFGYGDQASTSAISFRARCSERPGRRQGLSAGHLGTHDARAPCRTGKSQRRAVETIFEVLLERKTVDGKVKVIATSAPIELSDGDARKPRAGAQDRTAGRSSS